MAVRVEELTGPRNIGLLQSLNRIDWKSIDKIPQDLMARLTREEAQRLKNERGETYNGPFRLENDDIHLGPLSTTKPFKLMLINGHGTLEKSVVVQPTLIEVSKLPQKETIFVNFKEPIDKGEYYSNGDKY